MIIYISQPMHGHTEADTRGRAQRARNYINEVLQNGFREALRALPGLEHCSISILTPLDVAMRLDCDARKEAERAAMFNPAYAQARRPSDLDYLVEDLKTVGTANLVVALDGWSTSRGCLAEVALAKSRGIAVVELSEGMATCRALPDGLGLLDRVPPMGCTRTVADAFMRAFKTWRAKVEAGNPMAARLNQNGPDDDLPWHG